MFYADLHLHSKYSRATSGDADLEHMALWARRKGVAVVGTGDFTHPGWWAELREKLVPAEPGLFRLRDDLQRAVDEQADGPADQPTRFLLQVEISTIYKKGDRTRKVHHLLYFPAWDQAERLIQALGRIGNLASDGRPILGLDSRHLLEVVLASGDDGYLIPAHIWTPWFAVLGSKSGFDTVAECYGDLSGHVFAVETGLSSDPPMNWRLSQLDRFTLVSNSDAHSPPKIGREACAFTTALDYFAIREALATGRGYAGTVEFFPEEGKYHLDGHRKCGVCCPPPETRRLDGRCPVCGKGLTVGVMNRVEELADRPAGDRPAGKAGFRSLVPLPEVIAEIRGVGEKSRQVEQTCQELVRRLGPELAILQDVPTEEVRAAGWPLVAEALQRMRDGRVIRQAGYDGEYGTIQLFAPHELARGASVSLLFDLPAPAGDQTPPVSAPAVASSTDHVGESPWLVAEEGVAPRAAQDSAIVHGSPELAATVRGSPDPATVVRGSPDPATVVRGSPDPALGVTDRSPEARRPPVGDGGEVGRPAPNEVGRPAPNARAAGVLASLDPDQRAAGAIVRGPLLIVAGPGTGKTRTLTHRIAYLIAEQSIPAEQCLAITFSRRAADEIRERLATLIPQDAAQVPVMTFHALGLTVLREHAARLGRPPTVQVAGEAQRQQWLVESVGVTERRAEQLLAAISRHKRQPGPLAAASDLGRALAVHEQRLAQAGLVDFDDLIRLPIDLLEAHPEVAGQYRQRWPWISVDEYQDIDDGQYRLLRLLAPPDGNLCAIGDPDQSIYGFRGANPQVFLRFAADFPAARTVPLTRNYRSAPTIVAAALQAIQPSTLVAGRVLQAMSAEPQLIEIHASASERAEAEYVVHSIERLIGGSAFFALDSGRVQTHEGEALSFSDFAVLYRTEAQAEALVEALARSGIPFQRKTHGRLVDLPAVRAIVAWLQEQAVAGDGPVVPGIGIPGDGTGLPRPAVAGDGPVVPGIGIPGYGSGLQRQAVAWLEQAAAAVGEADSLAGDWARLLRPLAERCGADPRRLVVELTLGADADLWDPRADRVSLLTLHACKGLEFPVVFLVGCEDGLLPLRWGRGDDTDEAEERRLFFVGLTRARQRLILSHARQRWWRGQVRPMQASPFLQPIRDELLQRTQHRGKPRAKPAAKQLELF